MCYGFGAIITRDGEIWFAEPDSNGNISHSTILKRMRQLEIGLPDIATLQRRFVRVECPDWTEESFHWDEVGSLPVWLREDEVKEKVVKFMLRVKEVKLQCQRDRKALIEKYHKIGNSTRIPWGLHSEYVAERKEQKVEFRKRYAGFKGYVPLKKETA